MGMVGSLQSELIVVDSNVKLKSESVFRVGLRYVASNVNIPLLHNPCCVTLDQRA